MDMDMYLLIMVSLIVITIILIVGILFFIQNRKNKRIKKQLENWNRCIIIGKTD